LRKAQRKEMLNILHLVVKLSPHSSSFLECVERKAYNEKIQFAKTTIQDIDITGTYVVEFLRKSKRHWHARKPTRPRITSIDPVSIEESKEDETKEHHFVGAQIMQKDRREENVVA
jgi:hypothetical protein